MNEIENLETLQPLLLSGKLGDVVVQGLDLTSVAEALRCASVRGAVFLGCDMPVQAVADLVARGALVFPRLPGPLPYAAHRNSLYSPEELFDAFIPDDPCSYCDCLDARVYRHWERTGRDRPPSILEALARRLHDHALTDAMEELLASHGRVVAFMGGHSMRRNEQAYAQVARVSRQLTRDGYFMVSGGGPGAMEATHLGAWFAAHQDTALDEALRMLAEAPSYRDKLWLAQAFRVRQRWGLIEASQRSLGIPTWLYGHEPPNPFATHIAKYFENSVREAGLVAIATHGIVFAPGSAGTVQEIFQDVTENHYATAGCLSPMVFFGTRTWTEDLPVLPLIRKLAAGGEYAGLIAVTDDPTEIVSFLKSHPPVPASGGSWSLCRAHCDESAF